MKFGGTSVEDTCAFQRVVQIVSAHKDMRPVIVVSAMSRFTDALLQSVQMAADGNASAASSWLEDHYERHEDVASSLLGAVEASLFEAALNKARSEIRELCVSIAAHSMPHAALQDSVVSYGEQLSSTLLAAVLRENNLPAHYLDARRLIVTDDEHGRAAPLFAETMRRTRAELEPLIEAGEMPVLGGFIAASRSGATTTLGRGGSDYSAALTGAVLQAREIQIWTDVTGVLTADPRLVESARTIPQLSYREAAELAYFGAKVLHPKTMQPAVEGRIPVRVSNTRQPSEAGTVILTETAVSPSTVKAIAHKTGITIVQITSARMLGAYGFLRAIFEIFDRHRTVVDIVTTSEVSVSLSLDEASALPAIIEELRQLGTVEIEPRRAIICVVGEGLRSTPGIAAHVFSTIRDINVSLISLGASSVNLTFVLDEEQVREAVMRLHAAFFERAADVYVS